MRKNCLYPSDLTDEQWEVFQLALRPRQKRRGPGRPPTDLRPVCNGLLYLVRTGCAWRFLPLTYGPCQTVYGYFSKWTKQGCWQIIHDLLRNAVRDLEAKGSQPTAAILDSQRVRSADQAGERGYDKAKNTKGIKRHILVDTLGLLLAVFVTAADVPERQGARGFLGKALAGFRWLRCIWADGGYSGPDFSNWVAGHRKTSTLRLELIERHKGQKGFSVLPKRWIVERTFGWFMKHRRLVRHYEVKTSHAQAWLQIAMIGIMVRRLA
jgi:putative transposase